MPLTAEERERRHRERLLSKAAEYQLRTYRRKFVDPVFSRMIRAEAGADLRQYVTAIVDGKPTQVRRALGTCVCVTCGKIGNWNSGNYDVVKMDTGHFLGSRCNSIMFEEDGVAPQCSACNTSRNGAPQAFRAWMIAVHGPEAVERLERLRSETRSFSREELVDMVIAFRQRLKAAEDKMNSR